MTTLLKRAKELKNWGVERRRYLHQHPELSKQEKQTSAYCKKALESLGYEINSSWGYGFTADLISSKNANKCIAFRADMDALPIQEETNVDFISENKGVAHMCGHDVHMAIALTAAKLLSELRDQLNCNVRFILQPSEEESPGGAVGMIAAGCLNGVAEIYGLHNIPAIPVGEVATRVGPFMAAGDCFNLKIIGCGGHASAPFLSLNPIYAATTLICEWQTIIANCINPNDPAILTVSKFHAGNKENIIPEFAEITGIIRTFDEESRSIVKKEIEKSLKALEFKGYSYQIDYQKGYNTLANSEPGVNRFIAAAKEIVGIENIDSNMQAIMGSEDFCYYLEKIPGAFFFIGSGNEEKNISAPLHSSLFDVDEDVIPIGAAIMAELALQFC